MGGGTYGLLKTSESVKYMEGTGWDLYNASGKRFSAGDLDGLSLAEVTGEAGRGRQQVADEGVVEMLAHVLRAIERTNELLAHIAG